MLVKLGVDVSRLKHPMRRALGLVNSVYRSVDTEAVVTSTYEGDHVPSSLHYADLAVDFRLPKRVDLVAGRLREMLGNDYCVVPESTHLHVEYDPK